VSNTKYHAGNSQFEDDEVESVIEGDSEEEEETESQNDKKQALAK